MAGTLAACTRATKRAKSFFLAPLYDRVGCPNSVCVKLLAVYTAGICWSLRETAKSSCSTVEGSLAELSGRRQLKEQGGVGVLGCDSQEPSPVRDPGNNCTAARCRARRRKSNEVGGFRCPCPQIRCPSGACAWRHSQAPHRRGHGSRPCSQRALAIARSGGMARHGTGYPSFKC